MRKRSYRFISKTLIFLFCLFGILGFIGTELFLSTSYSTNRGDSFSAGETFRISSLPQLYLSGNILSLEDENRVDFSATMKWEDGSQTILPNGTIELQGASTRTYPKKNYNIRFNNKVLFNSEWDRHKKYTLKANWDDFSQSRNIVSGRIFGDIVRSRGKKDLLERAANGGVVDGFPIELYINKECVGVYTINIPKSKWMFAMTEKGKEAILNAKKVSTPPCLLEEYIARDFSNGWQLKYCSTEDSSEGTQWVVNSFNNLIEFLGSSSDEEFKKSVSHFTDIDRTIDAMLFTVFIGGYDVLSHNINWVTYDGQRWIPSPYDMEVTWGFFLQKLNDPILIRIDPREMLFGELDELLIGADEWTINRMSEYCHGNLLYRRVFENFPKEISERYFELRKNALSYESIEYHFGQYFKEFNERYYQQEKEMWPRGWLPNNNHHKEILEFAKNRGMILDSYFSELASQDDTED